MLDSYERQNVTAFWNGSESAPFDICNGVRQGAVLSATLFAVYMDELLYRLEASGIGCHVGDMYFGALAYADDLTLLCPTIEGLRKMIDVVESFGVEYCMTFNALKTQCMKFSQTKYYAFDLPKVKISGRELCWVEEFKYLGSYVATNLDDSFDIEKKRQDFVRQANFVLHSFSSVPAFLKDELLQTFCSSYYGSQSWDMTNKNIDRLQTASNIVQRRIWNIPNTAHCSVVKWLSVNNTVLAQLYARSCNFNNSLLLSNNIKLCFIARHSFNSANGIIGKNQQFCLSKLMVSHSNGKVLPAQFDGLPSEEDWRASQVIHELNFGLDGFLEIDLLREETNEILRAVSCD